MNRRYRGAMKRIGRKRTILVISVCLLLITAVGLTAAWLTAQSALMSNGFQKSQVTCNIEDDFNGTIKSDVRIRNTGSIDAYIRVALVPVWKDGENIVGLTASLEDANVVMGAGFNTAWVKGADGYYYCTTPVPDGEVTPVLIDSCTVKTKNGYRFELQIAAQALQALPATAVERVWGCIVRSDGKLEVPR